MTFFSPGVTRFLQPGGGSVQGDENGAQKKCKNLLRPDPGLLYSPLRFPGRGSDSITCGTDNWSPLGRQE